VEGQIVDCRIFTDPSNGATYTELLQSAQLVEQQGYAGFFLSDHYIAFAGDGLPGPTDIWTTLAGLARETSSIRLGSLVTPVTFRHPGPLAITVAQVDDMSSGRVEQQCARRCVRSRSATRLCRSRACAPETPSRRQCEGLCG
jgi:alkanesulfonate monooxygenase